MLPLGLALPDALTIAAVAIVTQTLVEVIGMVIYVRVIPWLLPAIGSVATGSIARLLLPYVKKAQR